MVNLVDNPFEVDPKGIANEHFSSLPDDPKTLSEFLENEVYDLDDIDEGDLEKLMGTYFKPYSKEEALLSPPAEGYVRLFRGEAPRRQDHSLAPWTGRWWAPFLDYAQKFATQEGGSIYYIDIPEPVAQEALKIRVAEKILRTGPHPDEFYLPQAYINGEANTPAILPKETTDQLLASGQYTKRGINSRRGKNLTETMAIWENIPEDERIHGRIRERLLDISFRSIYRFWCDYKEHNTLLAQKTDFSWDEQREIKDIKDAENLLAKICGWR